MKRLRYRIIGMDCANDAAVIEKAALSVPGATHVRASLASQVLTLYVADGASHSSAIEAAVGRVGFRLSPIPDAEGPAETAGDGDELPRDLAHITKSYKRALWIVVLLNVGYGVVEMAGGFLSGSQGLKADALDFLGDGLITLLGLLAIHWSTRWRALSALAQGIFLGALGLGVIVTTVYRALVHNEIRAELMGVFGLIALVVNVAAAAVLLPHRTGDANVRAVWLFSRNDAIGNAAVVAAAGLVAWTASPWPDLLVALVIAGLFMHSSSSIVRDARNDLREEIL